MPRQAYKYSITQLDIAQRYLDETDAPSVRELCRTLGVDSATVYRWNRTHSDFSKILAQVQEKKREKQKYFKRSDGKYRQLREDGGIIGTPIRDS